jgi:hypothetical protein
VLFPCVILSASTINRGKDYSAKNLDTGDAKRMVKVCDDNWCCYLSCKSGGSRLGMVSVMG